MGIRRNAKLWGSASVIALAGTLAACGGEGEGEGYDPNAPSYGAGTHYGEGEGGEGEGGEGGGEGSGGEFGVDPNEAMTDPLAFLTALEVIRAHYLAGEAAWAAGDVNAGGEMFGHPISEVYVDLEPTFIALGVAPFEDKMLAAVDAAFVTGDEAGIGEQVIAVYEALDAAEQKAPGAGAEDAKVQAGLIAAMLDRAALQFQAAQDGTVPSAYLDGYGFYRAAAGRAEVARDIIAAANPVVAANIATSINLFASAYPTAQVDALPDVEPGALLSSASELLLNLGSF